MPNLSAWLSSGGGTPTSVEEQRAALAWRRIQDKPLSIAFKTGAGVTLAEQTVRLESDNSATPSESAAGNTPRRKVIIFGIRNHATEEDTDIQEGYRFVYDEDMYRVVDIILTLGEIQAIAESTG